MSEQALDSNFSIPVARYDEQMNAIHFHPTRTGLKAKSISIYITLLHDPEDQSLVGISFTEFHMMILSLNMNGAIQCGSPLLLEEVLRIAKRLSGSEACNEALFRELRLFLGRSTLSIEDVLEIPQYALA